MVFMLPGEVTIDSKYFFTNMGHIMSSIFCSCES